MNIITPKLNWKGKFTPLDVSKIKYLVVHHAQHSTATVEDIHQWHLNNGWLGIGYNEYITKDGNVFIGRGDNQGAHVQGFNHCSYGICLQGDYEKEKHLPEVQYKALLERLKYHASRMPKFLKIVGHYELNPTKCPGQYAEPFLQRAKAEAFNEEDNLVMDLENSLKLLVEKGVINSPDYWKKACDIVFYLKEFIIKVATILKK